MVRFMAFATACTIVMLQFGCSRETPAVTAQQLEESLQGKWSILRSVYDGRDVSKNAAADSGLYFQSNTVKLVGSVIDQPLACTYDVTTFPCRVTMQSESGEPYLQGIVEVTGNTLRLCYRMHAKKDMGFPRDFESSVGSGLMLIEAIRSAPQCIEVTERDNRCVRTREVEEAAECASPANTRVCGISVNE